MIVYTADVHLTDKQPVNRVTPVQPNGMLKFQKLLKTAEDATLILGGDLFESPCPSYDLFNQVVCALAKHKGDVYTVFGNHDILYGEVAGNNNALRSLCNMGLVKELTLNPVKLDNYDVYGVSYKKKLYTDFESIGLNITNPERSIVVTHQFMSPKTLPFNHVPLKEFNTSVKYVLCSHLHDRFIETQGKTTYINPGCVLRINRNEAEQEPGVFILDGENSPAFQFLGEEFKDVEFMKSEVKKSEFIRSIDNAKVESQDIEAYIRESGESDEVKECALALIRRHDVK